MGAQFSSIKPRPYHSLPLIKSTSDTQNLNNKTNKKEKEKEKTTKRNLTLKELPSSTLLSKEKYFKLLGKVL
jgi:hypothetical protein